MKTTETAYIALPISGTDIKVTEARAKQAQYELEKKGYQVKTPFDIVPDELTRVIALKEKALLCTSSKEHRSKLETDIRRFWAKAMGYCLEYLVNCNLVYVLEGWSKSKGATLEALTAEMYGIKTIYEKTENRIK